MTLAEVRQIIDKIDPQIRELLMQRLDCSREVVNAKLAAGETTIFRADREEQVLARLGEGVPEDRLPGYLSAVRKIMETSRMYQYGLMYDRLNDPFAPLSVGLVIPDPCSLVTVRFSRTDKVNALSQILSMIGDYGYQLEAISQVTESDVPGSSGTAKDSAPDLSEETKDGMPDRLVTFDVRIRGSLHDVSMKKLMFQLSKECAFFRILGCE